MIDPGPSGRPDGRADRAVLITGCSSGIGLCVAQGLQSRGYRVFATARSLDDVQKLRGLGLHALRLDLMDSESITTAVDSVLEQTNGSLYALFNNGAYGQPGAVEDLSRQVLREQFETNFFGWHELTCLVVPVMRRQGHGRIIQNSSVLGMVAMAYRGAYNASKFALEGLTDTLRLELAGTGIHVSLIAPGPITSRFRENSFAAFKRNIDVSASAHHRPYRKVEKRLVTDDSTTPFTLPASAVLEKVIRALESPRPKPRYFVTVPTHAFGLLRRLLPTRWLDHVMRAVSREEMR